jgi:ribosomal protein S12 methylthiotransferase accessory factor
MQQPQQLPDSVDDDFDVGHGAAYMGKRERLPAFDFLLRSTRRRRLSDIHRLATGRPESDLTHLLDRLRRRRMEAIAVDLTTDEARRAGFWVVRVIIPSLQPLSFHYRTRYLGHPRLYEAPQAMGFPVRAEADLNPWPQPFA